MKKSIILTVAACFALVTSSATAELFDAGIKPAQTATVLGQKVTWPIPSLTLGTKAGTGVDANLSTKSVGFKIPFLAVNLPFPHAVVGVKNAKVGVGAFGVKAAGTKSKKTKKSKK